MVVLGDFAVESLRCRFALTDDQTETALPQLVVFYLCCKTKPITTIRYSLFSILYSLSERSERFRFHSAGRSSPVESSVDGVGASLSDFQREKVKLPLWNIKRRTA